MVNGKASWTSTSQAIWKYSTRWFIGSLDDIGENVGGINAFRRNQCPFNLPSEKLKYYNSDNGWIKAGAKEINIDCINGKFSTEIKL